MFEQLAAVEKRFEALTQALSDPAVLAQPARYQQVAKEHAGLTELVTTYRRYRAVCGEREANQTMLASEKEAGLRELIKEDLAKLASEEAQLTGKLTELLLPKDVNDEKNILLEIRAGTGGEEAALFAADLFRMYSQYATKRGWNVEILSTSPTGIGGMKEIISSISGQKVYSILKYESGVHRVQRVPKTEAQGRIHTSAVTVAVLPEADAIDVKVEEKDLRLDVFRASGPGGQSVNTTDSAVRITHLPTGLVVTCQDEKSQHKNRAKAMKILQARLYDQQLQQQTAERAKARKEMVGTGDRSERIRTYNFPQGRVTDHRIGLTLYQLDRVMEGDLEPVIEKLTAHYRAEALRTSGS